MRIAIMLRTLDEKGGIGVYTRNLIDTLLSVDQTNEYIFLYRNPSNVGRYAEHGNVKEHVIRGLNKATWDQIGVPMAARREGADVILHPKFTVPLLTRVPSVMVLHGADWFLPDAAHFYTRLDRLYMRIFMPLYLRSAAAVLSVSGLTTDHINRIFRMPDGKVRTTYFGPAPHFRRIEDPETLERVRRRYGLPDRFILTLSKAAGGERKNFRGVLDSYQRLHGTVPHRLVVGGKGLERFREDYGIPSEGWGADVLFPGWIEQEDLPAIYSLAELFLYPSNMEAFPIPVTEALACGTPIVTSDANGLREIAGGGALLVDPTRPEAVADAVRRIIHEPAVRSSLQQAGAERSRDFSWERCARQTLATLGEVAGTTTQEMDSPRS